MSYILKEDKRNEIKEKFRNKYLAKTLGKTECYICLVLNRKLTCPKTTAYSFTKIIDKDLEIEDLFERV